MSAQKMDVVQRSVIFHLRFKGEGSKRIHTELVETYGAGAYPIDSVKYWVKQCDGGRRDPIDLSEPGRLVSDVAEAVSQFLREEPFSSTRHIAAQLRLSRTSVKGTLVSVLGMRKFSLRWASHDLTEFQKAQCVKDLRGLLKALKLMQKIISFILSQGMRARTIGPTNTNHGGASPELPSQLGHLEKSTQKSQCLHLFSVDTAYPR
jgi:hypothetical protein